ncbi:flavodoxin family protein [Pseudarthrobacter sp. NPDC058329]|uniref:flavodoxin family protein n=1 Tax=Pseudarthrobacter sp. NPDC058329 TaxID=3346448 RepID=UPI0036DD3D4A
MVAEILAGAAEAGAQTELVRHDDEAVLGHIAAADGVVFGSPTYRASPTAAMRLLLERIDRTTAEDNGPLHRTPAMVAMTGASAAHFLGTRELSNTLSGFFGTQILSPDVYLDSTAFNPDGAVETDTAQRLRLHGAALVELTAAVQTSQSLQNIRPWI